MRPVQNTVKHRDGAGFSYPELLVTLTLFGIILALGVPSLLDYHSTQRALVTARALAADLRVAQQEAVTRRAAVAVVFSSADAACDNGPAYTVQVLSDTSIIKRGCFSEGVVWVAVPSPVTFETLGTPPAGTAQAQLQMQSSRTGKTYTVIVEGQTGAVTCQPEQELRCGG